LAKNFKLKIKNTQLAKVAGLDNLKEKLKKKASTSKETDETKKPTAAPAAEEESKPEPRRIRAKSHSSFAPPAEESEREKSEAMPEKIKEEAPKRALPIPKKVENAPPSPAPSEEKVKKAPVEKLGPTGKHVKDLIKTPPKAPVKPKKEESPSQQPQDRNSEVDHKKGKKVKDFKDVKPTRRQSMKAFDSRDRMGLSQGEDERWRKRRAQKTGSSMSEQEVIRPSELSIRLPITLKDLAAEMKLKASQLIQKLFLQGMTFTVNDFLDDDTTVQLLGEEFGCAITIDTKEEERIQITSQSIREEIQESDPKDLVIRPPVVAFMGHVDHGKTSLIDAIRKSSIAEGEAGAITQHIGAFKCKTDVGEITILDTPGHEAFSAMRARGAEVTDIVVLVVAGDEGIKEQTKEALHHAKAAGVTIVVAINKCDKPGFNAENVYRELSEMELLPEAWGGQTITVNTSALTKEGVSTLLEMLALQAEVLELKANPKQRARGSVLESELHKGMGQVATILVQNGTLQKGDAIVFERNWGRVRTMQDEHGKFIDEAPPSTPVEITGLSGLPKAGDPFIVVKSEKEAQSIVEAREAGHAERLLQQKKSPTLESFLQEGEGNKKLLKLIIRADVQGSMEALKASIQKIESDKVDVEIIFSAVGEISESDVQLAAASNAVILGFHTRVEKNAESIIKEHKVSVKLHDIIYHAIDDVKLMMTGLLDQLAEEHDRGEAQIQAVFKSSHLGKIAGCLISDGLISRNHYARVLRNGEIVWKGRISSIKREKEDVREVKKGLECGIVLDGFKEIEEGDVIQAYEIVYKSQEL
jgi:translation initiation factor IF-2